MRTVEVESPEHLILTVRLAGPGPRIVALLLDLLIQGVLIIIVILIAIGTGLAVRTGDFGSFAVAYYYIMLFLVQWGYFAAFELITRGRSPGKRIVRIRVVRANGHPLDLGAILVRNLLRVVDAFPLLYLAGGLISSIDKKNRRLGDFAAGTVVIHDPVIPESDPTTELQRSSSSSGEIALLHSRLNEEELYTLRRFLGSYHKLPEDRQVALASKLAERVALRLQISVGDDPIEFLEGVYSGHTAEDRE